MDVEGFKAAKAAHLELTRTRDQLLKPANGIFDKEAYFAFLPKWEESKRVFGHWLDHGEAPPKTAVVEFEARPSRILKMQTQNQPILGQVQQQQAATRQRPSTSQSGRSNI